MFCLQESFRALFPNVNVSFASVGLSEAEARWGEGFSPSKLGSESGQQETWNQSQNFGNNTLGPRNQQGPPPRQPQTALPLRTQQNQFANQAPLALRQEQLRQQELRQQQELLQQQQFLSSLSHGQQVQQQQQLLNRLQLQQQQQQQQQQQSMYQQQQFAGMGPHNMLPPQQPPPEEFFGQFLREAQLRENQMRQDQLREMQLRAAASGARNSDIPFSDPAIMSVKMGGPAQGAPAAPGLEGRNRMRFDGQGQGAPYGQEWSGPGNVMPPGVGGFGPNVRFGEWTDGHTTGREVQGNDEGGHDPSIPSGTGSEGTASRPAEGPGEKGVGRREGGGDDEKSGDGAAGDSAAGDGSKEEGVQLNALTDLHDDEGEVLKAPVAKRVVTLLAEERLHAVDEGDKSKEDPKDAVLNITKDTESGIPEEDLGFSIGSNNTSDKVDGNGKEGEGEKEDKDAKKDTETKTTITTTTNLTGTSVSASSAAASVTPAVPIVRTPTPRRVLTIAPAKSQPSAAQAKAVAAKGGPAVNGAAGSMTAQVNGKARGGKEEGKVESAVQEDAKKAKAGVGKERISGKGANWELPRAVTPAGVKITEGEGSTSVKEDASPAITPTQTESPRVRRKKSKMKMEEIDFIAPTPVAEGNNDVPEIAAIQGRKKKKYKEKKIAVKILQPPPVKKVVEPVVEKTPVTPGGGDLGEFRDRLEALGVDPEKLDVLGGRVLDEREKMWLEQANQAVQAALPQVLPQMLPQNGKRKQQQQQQFAVPAKSRNEVPTARPANVNPPPQQQAQYVQPVQQQPPYPPAPPQAARQAFHGQQPHENHQAHQHHHPHCQHHHAYHTHGHSHGHTTTHRAEMDITQFFKGNVTGLPGEPELQLDAEALAAAITQLTAAAAASHGGDAGRGGTTNVNVRIDVQGGKSGKNDPNQRFDFSSLGVNIGSLEDLATHLSGTGTTQLKFNGKNINIDPSSFIDQALESLATTAQVLHEGLEAEVERAAMQEQEGKMGEKGKGKGKRPLTPAEIRARMANEMANLNHLKEAAKDYNAGSAEENAAVQNTIAEIVNEFMYRESETAAAAAAWDEAAEREAAGRKSGKKKKGKGKGAGAAQNQTASQEQDQGVANQSPISEMFGVGLNPATVKWTKEDWQAKVKSIEAVMKRVRDAREMRRRQKEEQQQAAVASSAGGEPAYAVDSAPAEYDQYDDVGEYVDDGDVDSDGAVAGSVASGADSHHGRNGRKGEVNLQPDSVAKIFERGNFDQLMDTVRNMVTTGETLTKAASSSAPAASVAGRDDGTQPPKKKKAKKSGSKGTFDHFRFGPSSSGGTSPQAAYAAGLGVLVDEQGRPIAAADPAHFFAGMQQFHQPSGVGNYTIGEVIANVLAHAGGPGGQLPTQGEIGPFPVDPAPFLTALSNSGIMNPAVPVPWEMFGMRPVAGPLPAQYQGPPPPPMSPSHPPPPPPPREQQHQHQPSMPAVPTHAPVATARGPTAHHRPGTITSATGGQEVQLLEKELEASRREERMLEKQLVEVVRRNRAWQREVAQVLQLQIVPGERGNDGAVMGRVLARSEAEEEEDVYEDSLDDDDIDEGEEDGEWYEDDDEGGEGRFEERYEDAVEYGVEGYEQ
ncbi:hypothetical protein HK097_010753 [Rhizophlyctis rosea]|uniref:Uncharacterized protein n=1 Tax=Rhizophlyctis rosea TaxID=64517 RepID=A0AAD5S9W7_9FUNG|nr:hypothetical protein HK097_010753 [Rhizophlyctis rosea]